MPSPRLTVLAAIAVIAAGAVALPAGARGDRDSGVSGVLRGGCAPRDCRRASVATAEISIRARRSARVVRRLRARGGRFRVRLVPGAYTVTATVPGTAMRGRAVARVRAHRFVPVVVSLGPARARSPRPRVARLPVAGSSGR